MWMSKLRIHHFAIASIVVLGVGACGGGDDQEEAPVTTAPVEVALTEAELISEADQICAEVNAAIGTINASEATDEASKADQRGDIYLGLADRLDELGEPSDGTAPTEVIAAARELADSEGDETALVSFQDAANSYGLTACTEEPEAPAGTPELSDSGDGTDPDPSTSTPTPAPTPAPAPAPAPDTGGGYSPGGGSSGGGGSAAPSGGISPG
jgi:hypothetical protein